MERILKQRDRLLAASARLIGLTATAAALLLLSLPGSLAVGHLFISLPFFAALAFCQYRMGIARTRIWPAGTVAFAVGTAVLLRALASSGFGGTPTALTPGLDDALRLLLAVSAASASVLLIINLARMLVLAGAFLGTIAATALAFSGTDRVGDACLAVVAGWGGLAITGFVLSAGTLRAARRVSSIGRAHRSERQASETEAQRRQGARLLHDTVLATLTLLAHSGVGVSREALRRQAGDDARLLRQLRLSATPLAYAAEPVATGAPQQDSLDALKRRFDQLGLEVGWHGSATVGLRSDRLDSFLLALAECLENVRRHAGTNEAHVTITEDEKVVRALVTDNGNGFDPAAVPAGRLGYRESIVARLSDVGGTARVFSAQGAGTTVVLEVPR